MQHPMVSHLVSLLCVAAPTDTPELTQWETHLLPLQQAGLLTFWSERQMQAGADRMAEFSAHLDQADGVALLLSADFFADDTCLALMHKALLHQQNKHILVIPLLIRPVVWQASALGMLTPLPANGVAITTWESPDEGWRQMVMGLQRLFGLSAHLSPSLVRVGAATDRERMLRLLRRTYQMALSDSLQGIVWMELNLSEHPDAVRNATHLLQRLPNRTERTLPVGTGILSTYDQAEEELLILGTPGAGKSTLLLHLALRLIERAETDEAHPLPVIVPLSSWAVSRVRITDWLVEQLARIYNVPRVLGQAWVERGQVLPLLDGLDEMEEATRILCIATINTYHTDHLTPLVVCSRKAEYEVAASQERLLLQNAVVVQPLSKIQVAYVLQECGPDLAALHEVFMKSSMVYNLATTPLMLSVLMLTYRDTSIDDLPQQQARLEERIWTDYIDRMVRTKGADHPSSAGSLEKRYPLVQTCASLSWLAQQMSMHNQTLFYGESLQESWLPATQQRSAMWLLVRLPAMLIGMFASLLLSFFCVVTTDLATMCRIGILGAFLGWCLSRDLQSGTGLAFRPRLWREHVWQGDISRLLSAVLLGFLVAASYSLNLKSDYSVNEWLRGGVVIWIIMSISGWLLQGRLTRIMPLPDRPPARPTAHWTGLFGWIHTIPGCQAAIWTGTILGIGACLSAGLSNGLSFELSNGPNFWLSGGMIAGLILGGTAFLISIILSAQTETVHLAERLYWTGRTFMQFHHLRTSLIIVLVCFWFFGLTSWLRYAQITGRSIGLSFGLSDGLSIGLSVGLSFWCLVGLYQGITQEHMEDQDRRQFNQGLHRSLRNGVLLSLLSSGIITGIVLMLGTGLRIGLSSWLSGVISARLNAGLNVELSFGLSDGLSDGLRSIQSYGLSAGWLLALCGWLVTWAATGGLTILRHYMLRLLLARSQTFPWRAQRFLDDATARVLLRRVGGGYGFVHRRLLDYFATRASLRDEIPASK